MAEKSECLLATTLPPLGLPVTLPIADCRSALDLSTPLRTGSGSVTAANLNCEILAKLLSGSAHSICGNGLSVLFQGKPDLCWPFAEKVHPSNLRSRLDAGGEAITPVAIGMAVARRHPDSRSDAADHG